jgi:4-hydroxy 2-oxovalerate aldolase
MLNGLTLFDCTIREVGYQTGWFFDPTFLREYYRFLEAAGFDYMEIGFFHDIDADPNRGLTRYCSVNAEAIKEIFLPTKNILKISAMRDIQRPLSPIGKRTNGVVDVIRILTRSQETDLDILAKHVDELRKNDYEIFINFTSAGRNTEKKNIEFAKFAKKHGIDVIYFADTESIFTSKYVADVIEMCRMEGVEAGIHLHNKNGTAEHLLDVALAHGCKYTDTTLLGLGGKWYDGNISTEYLLKHFNFHPGYELTRLKTELIHNLIKYNEYSAAVLGK